MRCSHLVLVLLAACGGPRYRTELVGHGNGTVSSRASVRHDSTGGVQLPQGEYELAMRFDVPRAQIVDWKISCPGVELDGQVGEAFAQYRARRIAELQRERDAVAARGETAATIMIGGVARVDVDVAIRANPVLDLAPGDTGRGTLVASARVMTAGDGVCALQVTADDAEHVRAAFTVTRIRDVDAEQRVRTVAARQVAVVARGELAAQLVTGDARDPEQARVRVDARHEAHAIYARQEYLAYLAGQCNAEPGHRDRIAGAREARLMAYAETAQRRDQLALRARADLRTQLVALGAHERPPVPAPVPEAPGIAPYAGAEWTAGSWSWESGGWQWHDGGWAEPSIFDVDVDVRGVREHRRERVRDRSNAERSWIPSSRDASSSGPARTPESREDARRAWVPRDADNGGARVRDHRKDKDDDDDDKPSRVRDHRQ